MALNSQREVHQTARIVRVQATALLSLVGRLCETPNPIFEMVADARTVLQWMDQHAPNRRLSDNMEDGRCMLRDRPDNCIR